MPADVTILRKPNVGYDFGSWTVALNRLPAIAGAPRVVLTNDSMAGPFASLATILRRCETAGADVVGLTDSRQYFHHLQSYFLCFNNGVLRDRPLAGFFDRVRVEHDKWEIIRRYELGLSKLLGRESYGMSPLFPAAEVVGQSGDNPVIKAWWRLLERGFPFVKREIVRDPELAPRGEWIAPEVRAVYGVDIEDWI
jgi:lipopolysaccharide biosynthesis protein